MQVQDIGELESCKIKLRDNPQRRKEKVLVGCGAGFGGDRSLAALKLLQRVDKLDYLVLECLAERTLADRYQIMMSGGDGFDPRIVEWMSLLLPLSVGKGVCIITNMGAVDPLGAQKAILEVANSLALDITVSVVNEIVLSKSGTPLPDKEDRIRKGGVSTYLGAAPIVQCLEKYRPQVIVTSRVADAALFLAPMVYELGWNWNDFEQLAKGSLAGHLLECGCQLTGGYFMHPGDKYRNFPIRQLLDLSLPYAEVSCDGEVCLAKAVESGGVLNCSTCSTCTEQLLYEVGDPSVYITPDIILCFGARPSGEPVPDKLLQLVPKDCGWKGWGEISYGGYECVKRAEAARFLVKSWMEEAFPGVGDRIVSYIIGFDSLKVARSNADSSSSQEITDVRLRMDGLFEKEEHAAHFALEFMALYTNGPAGGGGISTGHRKQIVLSKELVRISCIFICPLANSAKRAVADPDSKTSNLPIKFSTNFGRKCGGGSTNFSVDSDHGGPPSSAAPSGEPIPLYQAAHSRTGDKGNDLNFSIIPHFPGTSRGSRLTSPRELPSADPAAAEKRDRWMEENLRVEIYEVRGVHSLNVVVRNVLDGGVNCSRRIDRHGKTVSDLILSQEIVLP
ncbi:unnamed protein product [Spirodela intermedia]|uniref:Uncharacterized protein n=1 Tax=Spirodela intermedia TaxID=51605 RepID=A0A7I8IFH7_SPIIN|nr:unnamed protein product [Spirodela intermedia]CAA6655632.1 unnamed protein product [Spirodela intermedia]